MNNELRERDLLWCRALIATLGTDDIAKVTAEFNRIRPDKAVEHSVQRTAESIPQIGSLEQQENINKKVAE